MPLSDLGDLLSNSQHRVEARAGVLEHEAVVAAGERGVSEHRPRDPAGDLRVVRQQSGERQRQRALARAALADDRETLAGDDFEVDGFQRSGRLSVRPVGDRQAGQAGQQRTHARALRFASASASPSEKR